MICPICKGEYREGYTMCAECGVPLVEGLPEEESPNPDIELVAVFETGEPADLLVAKSLLDDAGIEFFARGEGVQDMFGAGRIGSGFNTMAGQVEIQVRPEDADDAHRLLMDLDARKNAGSTSEPDEEEDL